MATRAVVTAAALMRRFGLLIIPRICIRGDMTFSTGMRITISVQNGHINQGWRRRSMASHTSHTGIKGNVIARHTTESARPARC